MKTKTLTQLEMLKEKGYTKKQIELFYKRKEKLAKINIRYTIKHFEMEL